MPNPITSLVTSTLGRKLLVAATGLLLLGFVISHLSGNLLIFQGQDALNSYAAFLKSMPGVLWGARIGLLVITVVHLWGTLTLTARNRQARPVHYQGRKSPASTFASRWMVLSGLTILLFVIYHLLHFTVGATHPDHYALQETVGEAARHDVYGMVVAGFQIPWVSAIYIAAQILLGMHLAHGISSVVQTLGINHPTYTPLIRRGGVGLAVLLALGNCSIPVAVLAGWIGDAA
ncbi:MAG: succinate dehydrogenase cytochrome b subunit [Planctomycetota bacterium]